MTIDLSTLTQEQLDETVKWANLGRSLVTDKRTRAQAEKLAKVLSPEIETSEDLAEPVLAPVRSELEEVKNQLKKITDGAAEWAKQEKFSNLRKQGYTDEGISKIEEIMQAKGINDPEVAAAVFDKTNPPAKPKLPGMSSPTFGSDIFGAQGASKEDLELLTSNPDAFMDMMANKVWQETENNE